jgi:hypothetical protein
MTFRLVQSYREGSRLGEHGVEAAGFLSGVISFV